MTDPLEASLKGLLTNVTEGDNPIGNALKSILHIPASTAGAAAAAQSVAQTAQNTAIATTTTALGRLTLAANSAAGALGGKVDASTLDSISGGVDLGDMSASDVDSILDSTGGSSGGSSGGGFSFGSLIPIIASLFHSGGVVGSTREMRPVPASVFAGATRYHGGGVAGLRPDEVAAVLKKGEEVITRDDPRHRDNGGMSAQSQPARAGNSTVNNFNISVPGSMTRASTNQLAADLARKLAVANSRFN